jgi:hypothetical protein
MSLTFLFHDLMLNMFRLLVHPSSGACDLFVELFHGLYCSGMMCVGVCWCYIVVWLWWCGIRMQADTLPQCYTNTHHTRAIQPMK